jgi:hypothetical protein
LADSTWNLKYLKYLKNVEDKGGIFEIELGASLSYVVRMSQIYMLPLADPQAAIETVGGKEASPFLVFLRKAHLYRMGNITIEKNYATKIFYAP